MKPVWINVKSSHVVKGHTEKWNRRLRYRSTKCAQVIFNKDVKAIQ